MQFISKFIRGPLPLFTRIFTKQPLITPLAPVYYFGNSQQKVLVRNEKELIPFTLNNLWDNQGARHKGKRIGRGRGSGKGKTAGRGDNGQKSRAGGSIPPMLEGRQTPIHRRLPKWGMLRSNRQRFEYINLQKIVYLARHGRIDPNKPVTIKTLYEAGAFKKIKYGVKILSNAGGSVKCLYRTSLKIKEHIKPHLFSFKLDEPVLAPKAVKKMENIRERGAQVVYNEPEWVAIKRAQAEKVSKEMKDAGFEYPVRIYEGMGKDKIRKRRQRLFKHIDLGLEKPEKEKAEK